MEALIWVMHHLAGRGVLSNHLHSENETDTAVTAATACSRRNDRLGATANRSREHRSPNHG